jgi:two-component system KDP operon response regulator KdpE
MSKIGDLELDLERHILRRCDDEIHLSPKEFDLLAFMMKNAGAPRLPGKP